MNRTALGNVAIGAPGSAARRKANLGELVSRLRQIRDISTMEKAGFWIGDEPVPFGANVTDLVRISTRNWRETWITGPLTELIDALEDEKEPIL